MYTIKTLHIRAAAVAERAVGAAAGADRNTDLNKHEKKHANIEPTQSSYDKMPEVGCR